MKHGGSFRSALAIFIITILIVTIFTISIPVVQDTDVAEMDDGIVGPTKEDVTGMGFVPVNVLLKEGYELSPKDPRATDFDLQQSCPNGYVGDGLFGLGIITLFGHVQWKTVGIWKTNELKTDLVISGKIKYTLWLYNRQNSQTGDFRISLLVNDKEIGPSKKEYNNFNVKEEPQALVIEFDAGGNITPLVPSDVLAMKVEARIQSGAFMYYNGPSYRSGVMLTCNSLRVPGLRYDKDDRMLIGGVSDAFGLPPSLLNPVLLIDETLAELDYSIQLNSETLSWELVYFLELLEWLRSGEHSATLVVAYSKAAPVNITASYAFRYEPPPKPLINWDWFQPQNVCPIILLIGLIVGLVAIYKNVRKRRKKKGLDGLIGKPGGLWDRRRKKQAIKKSARMQKKEEKKRLKSNKKQQKLDKKRRR